MNQFLPSHCLNLLSVLEKTVHYNALLALILRFVGFSAVPALAKSKLLKIPYLNVF